MRASRGLVVVALFGAAALVGAACGDSGGTNGTQGTGGGAQPSCGDQIPDPDLGEECDDGNLDDADDCLNDCTKARCGDTIVHAGFEDCDDGNLDDADECLSTCVTASCGDGFIQAGVEDCDDGNEEDGDACSSSCTAGSGCGNGVTEAGEDCDDGNDSNTDDCTSACLFAACGDGFAQVGLEDCDDGNAVDDDACSNACTVNVPDTTSCPGTPANVAANGDVTLGGDTSTSQDNYQGPCGGDGSNDVVFAFTADSSGLLNVDMVAVNADLDPVLYVREGTCEDGASLGCADATYAGGYESLSIVATAGQTYYVFADGWGGTTGEFLVSATLLTEVPGDDCPGVNIPLTGSGDTYNVSGNTSAANADRLGTGLCDSVATPEIVYKVTAPVSSKLFVSVDPTYDASVYIRSTCTSQASQLVCAEAGGVGGLEVASVNVTAGSTYYVFIDGYDGDAGAFDAEFFLQ